MIAYEELCEALDRHNLRKQGGATPPAPARHAPAAPVEVTDDLDIVESEDIRPPAQPPEFGTSHGETPAGDVTAETEMPDGSTDPRYRQPGYGGPPPQPRGAPRR
jgi:hypothetical protein